MGGRLKRKVAIVTGAGSIGAGIGNGKASAIIYAREGAQVMVVDCNLKASEETSVIIEQEGGNCVTFVADVSKSIDCKNMVEECIRTYGKVDILHNNVGIAAHGGLLEISEETWDRVMNVNLKSMFLACKYTVPYMLKQGSGCIINISSITSLAVGPQPQISYAVSKAGIHALTKEIAIEYAAKGIRANTIILGSMKTPMAASVTHTGDNINKIERERDARIPIGRQGDAWDSAHAALFLASDEAKYITGTTLVVDGGISGTRSGWKPNIS